MEREHFLRTEHIKEEHELRLTLVQLIRDCKAEGFFLSQNHIQITVLCAFDWCPFLFEKSQIRAVEVKERCWILHALSSLGRSENHCFRKLFTSFSLFWTIHRSGKQICLNQRVSVFSFISDCEWIKSSNRLHWTIPHYSVNRRKNSFISNHYSLKRA